MHLLDTLSPDRLSLCAHRGDSHRAPENTLAALRAAVRAGAAMAEIDVRVTADKAFVLMHDRAVDRTTDGDGLVEFLNKDAVARLDAGQWFSPAFTGEPVPTLRDALDLARETGMGLLIEIKERVTDAAWLTAFAAEIMASGAADLCVVSSFDHVQLASLKAVAPALRTAGIGHLRAADPVAVARAARLDVLILESPWYHADDARALRKAGVAAFAAVLNPDGFDRRVAQGSDELLRLHAMIADRAVSMLVVDDVAWAIERIGQSEAGLTCPSVHP